MMLNPNQRLNFFFDIKQPIFNGIKTGQNNISKSVQTRQISTPKMKSKSLIYENKVLKHWFAKFWIVLHSLILSDSEFNERWNVIFVSQIRIKSGKEINLLILLIFQQVPETKYFQNDV